MTLALGFGDGAAAARIDAADPISGAKMTVKKCHRQRIRRFLASRTSARNAVSYTKRRRVPASVARFAAMPRPKHLVLIDLDFERKPLERRPAVPGTWLAPVPNQQIDFGTINGPRH
jgi:hypothetical protein